MINFPVVLLFLMLVAIVALATWNRVLSKSLKEEKIQAKDWRNHYTSKCDDYARVYEKVQRLEPQDVKLLEYGLTLVRHAIQERTDITQEHYNDAHRALTRLAIERAGIPLKR